MTDVTKNLDELARTMERLSSLGLETALSLGADDAKISASASFQKRMVVENKEFTLANSLESRGLSIVVHKDKKKGSASINTASEASVKQAVRDALALAEYSVPDEALTFASAEEAPPAKPLAFLYDEAMAAVELPEIQGAMQEVLGLLVRDPRMALDRYEMQTDVSFHTLTNTRGMRQSERQTMASWSFFGMAREADEVTGFDYDGSFAFSKGDMLPRSRQDAEAFTAKILGALHPRQCPSYRGAVLFSPRAVQELLLGMILFHAGGRQVMDGKSRWDKQVGQKVVSELLSLRDNPHDKRYSGVSAFDADGLPTKAFTLIENGILNQHLHDIYSAKRCGARATGTAGGPFAVSIDAGKTALPDLLKAAGPLLVVDRFSGNSDPIKGDFSGVAKASRLHVGGVDQGPVTETMIAGNFFEMAQAVLAVTSQVEIVGGSFQSPYILIDGVSVTGEG